MDKTITYALFAYLIVNFALTFVWPSYRVWKRTGVLPVTFSNRDTAHDYIGGIFKILLALLLVTGAVYAFFPQFVPWLIPVWYLEHPDTQITGLFMLFIAIAWIAIAQFQMSDSWRIGIDEKNKTELVTAGVFRISRNPIFLGMLTTLLGLFLVIPNLVTAAVLMTAYCIVQVQVRLEEEFLEKTHGQVYLDYRNATRRWL